MQQLTPAEHIQKYKHEFRTQQIYTHIHSVSLVKSNLHDMYICFGLIGCVVCVYNIRRHLGRWLHPGLPINEPIAFYPSAIDRYGLHHRHTHAHKTDYIALAYLCLLTRRRTHIHTITEIQNRIKSVAQCTQAATISVGRTPYHR